MENEKGQRLMNERVKINQIFWKSGWTGEIGS
jgi:hypothetical protein